MSKHCSGQGSSRLFKQSLTAAVSERAHIRPHDPEVQSGKRSVGVMAGDNSPYETEMANLIITQGLKSIGRCSSEDLSKQSFKQHRRGRGRGMKVRQDKPDPMRVLPLGTLHAIPTCDMSNKLEEVSKSSTPALPEMQVTAPHTYNPVLSNACDSPVNPAGPDKMVQVAELSFQALQHPTQKQHDEGEQNVMLEAKAQLSANLKPHDGGDLPDLVRCQLSLEENQCHSQPVIPKVGDEGDFSFPKPKEFPSFSSAPQVHHTYCHPQQVENRSMKSKSQNESSALDQAPTEEASNILERSASRDGVKRKGHSATNSGRRDKTVHISSRSVPQDCHKSGKAVPASEKCRNQKIPSMNVPVSASVQSIKEGLLACGDTKNAGGAKHNKTDRDLPHLGKRSKSGSHQRYGSEQFFCPQRGEINYSGCNNFEHQRGGPFSKGNFSSSRPFGFHYTPNLNGNRSKKPEHLATGNAVVPFAGRYGENKDKAHDIKDRRRSQKPVPPQQHCQSDCAIQDENMEDWDIECSLDQHEQKVVPQQDLESAAECMLSREIRNESEDMAKEVTQESEFEIHMDMCETKVDVTIQEMKEEVQEVFNSSDQQHNGGDSLYTQSVHKMISAIYHGYEAESREDRESGQMRTEGVVYQDIEVASNVDSVINGEASVLEDPDNRKHCNDFPIQGKIVDSCKDKLTAKDSDNEIVDKCEDALSTAYDTCDMSTTTTTYDTCETTRSDENDVLDTTNARDFNINSLDCAGEETDLQGPDNERCSDIEFKESKTTACPIDVDNEPSLIPSSFTKNFREEEPSYKHRPCAESSHTSDICSKSSSDFVNSTFSEMSSDCEAEICSQSESGDDGSPSRGTNILDSQQNIPSFDASFPPPPYFKYPNRYFHPQFQGESRGYANSHPVPRILEDHAQRSFQSPHIVNRHLPGEGYRQPFPFFLPSFPPHRFTLPAESVGSEEAMRKIVMFIESCSANVKEYMRNIKDSYTPLDVSVNLGLCYPTQNPPLYPLPTPSHPPYQSESCPADQQRAQYETPLSPAISPAASVPLPPPPYWNWGAWSKYSHNMDTSRVDGASLYGPYYPSLNIPASAPLPAQSSSKKPSEQSRVDSASSEHYNPGMYSYWGFPPPSDYSDQEKGVKWPNFPPYPHSDYWTGRMAGDFTKSSQHFPDAARIQLYRALTEREKRENIEAESSCNTTSDVAESVDGTLGTKKRSRNPSGQFDSVTNELPDSGTEPLSPPPPLRPPQKSTKKGSDSSKNDGRTEYMHSMSISRFLNSEMLKNDWSKYLPSHQEAPAGKKTSPKGTFFREQHTPGCNDVSRLSQTGRVGQDSGQCHPENINRGTANSDYSSAVLDPYNLRKPAKFPVFVPKVTKTCMPKLDGPDSLNWRDHCAPLDSQEEDLPIPHTSAWRNGLLNTQVMKRRSDLGSSSRDTQPYYCDADTTDEHSEKAHGKRRLSEPVLREEPGSYSSLYSSRLWGDARLNPQSASSSQSEVSGDSSRAKEWAREFVARSKRYQHKFIDSHCHIDFLYSRLDIHHKPVSLKTFREKHADYFPANYEGCVAVFCNPRTFCYDNPKENVLKAIADEEGVWLALGCHPKNATEFREAHILGLKKILRHPKVVALGEIGLDYSGLFGQHADIQKHVFRQQLSIALEMKLPLVIHCRDADDDCLDILKEVVPYDYKIHAHCFTRNITVAWRWMAPFPNLFLGLTPIISYKTAIEAINTAANIPLSRLLLETDAPYFVPGCVKNADMPYSYPGFALYTAEKVAELKGIAVDDVLQACRENTRKMYGI